MAKTIKEKVLEDLIISRKISKSELEFAKEIQYNKGISLDKALIDQGLIQEEELLSLLVQELNVPFVNLSKYKIDPALKEIIPQKVAYQYRIVPLSVLGNVMTIAVSDPLNVFVVDDLKNITGKQIDIVMSLEKEIVKAMENYYGLQSTATVTEVSQDIQKDIASDAFEIVMEGEVPEHMASVIDESEKAPIIRMVNLVIEEAIRQRASDIHIEPAMDVVRVRYRIDGALREILEIPKENQNAVIVRIKIMSRLDITANQVPQDGRFKLKISHKEIDFRVSLLPTTFGQKVVMRVLDKRNLSSGLSGLGLNERSLAILREGIHKPFGMILVTGPTGSGKSTTLYSIINELNTVDRNIITIEDPVEYLIEGLTQIQTRSEIGLTFAEGLRAVLRQSPDVVMVGEIRDNETADIAIKASLTGQIVLSTLHTNDAAGALTRLVDMGVEPFLVGSSLILVTAQRLCRKVCPQCKEPVAIDENTLKRLKYDLAPKVVFYHGKGCDLCHQTGYFGRTSITEILEIDDNIRYMLLSGDSSDKIKEYALKKKGMTTLWADAMDKCVSGIISLEEVLRVTTSD
ncbi:MAG: Flp pilus assembly complex ATPase component TadA [Candidatus Omnitrophica bacterium]|nr:Flp pilus assembly complex ATPase component TadA [Candidatus Omnitrophota bacterium]